VVHYGFVDASAGRRRTAFCPRRSAHVYTRRPGSGCCFAVKTRTFAERLCRATSKIVHPPLCRHAMNPYRKWSGNCRIECPMPEQALSSGALSRFGQATKKNPMKIFVPSKRHTGYIEAHRRQVRLSVNAWECKTKKIRAEEMCRLQRTGVFSEEPRETTRGCSSLRKMHDCHPEITKRMTAVGGRRTLDAVEICAHSMPQPQSTAQRLILG